LSTLDKFAGEKGLVSKSIPPFGIIDPLSDVGNSALDLAVSKTSDIS
jgi:hypothetical protein